MGTLASLTIVKLGGSLITYKDQPLSINTQALQVVARELRNFLSSEKPGKIFLIHGGGSFGHFYAKQFSLNTKFSRIKTEGVAMTLTSMLQLHSLVLKQLNSEKVFCATILPSELISLDGKGITTNGATRIQSILSCDLI
ncbi:MAG: hypothetical protein ACHQ1H_12995, partial [Nitrososphaerales archaeon]